MRQVAMQFRLCYLTLTRGLDSVAIVCGDSVSKRPSTAEFSDRCNATKPLFAPVILPLELCKYVDQIHHELSHLLASRNQ